jgi:hypothetical protein
VPPILQHVVDALQRELHEAFIGALWVGSRAYGVPRPRSDWDLFVVHEGAWRQRRRWVTNGESIECFINPVPQVVQELHDPDHPATLAMFVPGRIVADRAGIVAGLVRKARELWISGPLRMPPQAIEQWRYAVTTAYEDWVDADGTGDRAGASWLVTGLLRTVLEGYYRYQEQWRPASKHLIADLGRVEAVMAAWVEEMLTAGPTRSLVEALVRAGAGAGGRPHHRLVGHAPDPVS